MDTNTAAATAVAAPTGPPDAVDADRPRFSKDSWLGANTDLEEADVPVDALGDSVRVRALSAGQLARIQDQCTTVKGTQVAVDTERMERLTFLYGVVAPQFEEREVQQIQQRIGKAFSLVVATVNEISRASDEDVDRARARFRPRR